MFAVYLSVFCFLVVCKLFLYRGVAQPGSAPALGAGCRGFKSLRPDQLFSLIILHTFPLSPGAKPDGVFATKVIYQNER